MMKWCRIGILLLLFAASVAVLLMDLVSRCHTPAGAGHTQRIVSIPPAASFRRIVRALEKQGIVHDPLAFRLAARYLGVERKLKAGEYDLNDGMTPMEVLDRLYRGDVVRYRFTVPEGAALLWVAERLERRGLGRRGRFLGKATDSVLLNGLGVNGSSAEGYLFPDSYFLTRDMTEEAIIRMMVRRFWQVFTPQMKRRARERGFSIHQVVTLASIVEKETGAPEERPLIAAVFLNRLARNIRLQSDPTVIYGLDHFDGNLNRRDLQTKTPYNTYKIRGLPPGPIANPGLDSLMAVLYPAPVDYLYFVSRNDGTHHFSTTLREHNRAVWKYQKSNRSIQRGAKKDFQ
ncbi:MAG: endolytic transglycosylase MltG [Deltaproteobacteria bacterium]|nr:endolytic transglycosylase MltG [Deltaproteobacteria bacterium]MBW2308888.1 endolytic transglycosylase MltG [Deltaproteobacteria bacterium]